MKIFMYPIENPKKSATQNPYVRETINSLKISGFSIVNEERPTNYGLLNLIPFLFRSDVFYFNWVEDVSEKRFGYLQNLFLFFLMPILKLLNKKIIWIMHNKISHSKKNRLLKIINFYIMVNYSDIVITHSKDGIVFGRSFLKYDKTIFFKHLPVNSLKVNTDQYKKEYDLLIWGNISAYKGVVEFLEQCKNTVLKDYRLCIAGKIIDDELKNKLQSYESENVSVLNQFISDEELDILFKKTEIVLFTYSGFSTLSSAALMHSLERDCKVIGPHVGVFKDLAEDKIITTYTKFEDLPMIIERNLNKKSDTSQDIQSFFENNTWKQYGQFVSELVKDLK